MHAMQRRWQKQQNALVSVANRARGLGLVLKKGDAARFRAAGHVFESNQCAFDLFICSVMAVCLQVLYLLIAVLHYCPNMMTTSGFVY